MTHILLTGAGFSANWGGWLVSEAFEYLIGCTNLDDETKNLLWLKKLDGGGFEDVLADLQNQKNAATRKRLKNLTTAITTMFRDMERGFKRLEFSNRSEVDYSVQTFLSRFDAIFTLNQDTLLEQKYLDIGAGAKWARCEPPGLKRVSQTITPGAAPIWSDQLQADVGNYKLHPQIQPYFKLHGSTNWIDEGRRVLIMGGRKAAAVDQFPLLTRLHQEFQSYLSRPQAKLMVIGYSFNDKQINDAIDEGVVGGLKLFIIDPRGVDVLDKRQEGVGRPRIDPHMDKLKSNIIGASRRPISSTFNDDRVEHAKVMRFFS